MKATMESTNKKVVLNGLEFRVWEGVTEKGIPFVALMNRLETVYPEMKAVFIKELTVAQKAPETNTAGALDRLGVGVT
jgi:hypothetical protein